MKHILITSFLILTASFFFVINDAIINYIAPRGIEFYHFIFYGSPAYLFVPLYLLIKGDLKRKLKATNYFIPLFRSLLFAPMPFITFVSLKNISLPEFTTLNMSSPIFGTIYAFFLLKEKFNSLLLFSLFLGTLGVLFVVQPGFENFNPYFLLVLFGAFIITGTTVIVNKYHYVTSNVGFFMYGGLFIHTVSFIIFLSDPILVSLNTFFLITIASILINGAIFFITTAFQRAQKYYSSVFCLVYFQILYSILIGFFIFDEYLNFYAVIGAILIILSGIFSIPSQHKQKNA
tara:strand:- start:11503 stop:12372 length:870 start_codon:yes stop_codon:yes gene_type:complete